MAELLGLHAKPSDAAASKQRARCAAILDQVAQTLDAYGYAVLDNYIGEAAVQGARKELRVMQSHYTPGLIWVGSEAESGAQIAVNAVRGDVVLWLDDQVRERVMWDARCAVATQLPACLPACGRAPSCACRERQHAWGLAPARAETLARPSACGRRCRRQPS